MNIDFGGIAVDKAFMQAGVNDNVFLESLTYESADTGNSVLIKFHQIVEQQFKIEFLNQMIDLKETFHLRNTFRDKLIVLIVN